MLIVAHDLYVAAQIRDNFFVIRNGAMDTAISTGPELSAHSTRSTA